MIDYEPILAFINTDNTLEFTYMKDGVPLLGAALEGYLGSYRDFEHVTQSVKGHLERDESGWDVYILRPDLYEEIETLAALDVL